MIVNTVTTVVTFLMMFVIQATQIRDTEAMHLKLIRVTAARNELIAVEENPIADTRAAKESFP